MIINVTYDASAAAAPAGFKTAVNFVVALFESDFTNPVTINLDVGWGEVNGQTIDQSALGESLESYTNGYSYAQILRAFTHLAASGADPIPASFLPSADPSAGGTFDPGTADARALGLMPATSGSVDGWIGLSSTPGTFFFDQANPVPGEYDAIAVIEHEISEVMGRDAGLNPAYYSPLDLFRFSAPATLDLNGKHSDYFSIDNGAANLDNFSTDPNGDFGDWADSAGNDAFVAFSSSGVANTLTTTDLLVMAALGWSDIPAVLASAFTDVLWTTPTSALATTPTLTLAGGTTVPNPIYGDANALASLSSQVSGGQILVSQALADVEQFAVATTTVSTLAYEFFTGATPNALGYQYLISGASNPNNLDSSYYAEFNIQNRFINFAVNLGEFGAGATPFNDTYGSLSLSDAATAAYTEIFGVAPAAGKIDAILDTVVSFNGVSETRAQYFAYYGGDGVNGIGTKAALVGWLLEVAVQADIGPYAKAGDAFLSALALGNAPFHVDLLPTYGFTHHVPFIGVSG